MRQILYVGLFMTISGCVQSAQSYVEVPLEVAGTDHHVIETTGGAQLSLTRADLAFGPLYLCAGERSGALCEDARLEWLDAVIVDAIEPSRAPVGQLVGVTGVVRSWMYDLGISSLFTRETPVVSEAAARLGDTSLVLEGHATVGEVDFAFEAHVAVSAGPETERGVPLVRSAASRASAHDVAAGERLLLVFDPEDWVLRLDFDAYFETETCASVVRAVACEGQLEHRCASDGTTMSSRDCQREGLVCLAGLGCQETLRIEPDDAAYRALRNALVSSGGPMMIWSEQP